MDDAGRLELFRLGADSALKRWEPLQHAVEHQWGGDDSEAIAEWIPSAIVDRFGVSH